MLKIIYRDAVTIDPFASRSFVSRAKEENVVKPPQMPTFKNKVSFGSIAFFVANDATIPMRNAPRMLIQKVLMGKPESGFKGSSPMRYRRTAPTKPPAPIIKHCCMIKFLPLCDATVGWLVFCAALKVDAYINS
jgi:hypothetical protein